MGKVLFWASKSETVPPKVGQLMGMIYAEGSARGERERNDCFNTTVADHYMTNWDLRGCTYII